MGCFILLPWPGYAIAQDAEGQGLDHWHDVLLYDLESLRDSLTGHDLGYPWGLVVWEGRRESILWLLTQLLGPTHRVPLLLVWIQVPKSEASSEMQNILTGGDSQPISGVLRVYITACELSNCTFTNYQRAGLWICSCVGNILRFDLLFQAPKSLLECLKVSFLCRLFYW